MQRKGGCMVSFMRGYYGVLLKPTVGRLDRPPAGAFRCVFATGTSVARLKGGR